MLLGEFWDPTSGAIFAEEGDQQRFWKLTKRFAQDLAAAADEGTSVRVVRADCFTCSTFCKCWHLL